MGTVVALDQFRQDLDHVSPESDRPPQPSISGGEVWDRDYTDVESVVFGLLKVRAIVAHYMGTHDAIFDQCCMDSLEAAYAIGEGGSARLKAAIKPLKEWILDEMTEDNKRDMSWALVLLDLIEKSPDKRNR